MTIQRAVLTCIVMFLIAASTFSCDKQTERLEVVKPTIQMAVAENPCNYLDEYDVNMEFNSEEPEMSSEYNYHVFFGETQEYNLADHCVCKVKEVVLTFDFLPAASQIQVTNDLGTEIAFAGPFNLMNGPGEYIKIYPGALEPSLYIAFNFAMDPAPLLINAGGYCVVDNLSGPKTPFTMTEPYLEYNEQTKTTDIFLPVIQ